MRRREFITLLGGTPTWPIAARSQQQERARRIGVLTGRSEDNESQAWLGALKERLGQRGWKAGQNLRIEVRAGSAVERRQTDADDLVKLQPDAILAVGNPRVVALSRATQRIPIVFALVR